jgi:diadenylate cyclase
MSVNVSAIIQIAILYFAIYAVLKSAKGSRFGQALTGIGVITAVFSAFSLFFHFDVLSQLVQFLLSYLAISIVVIFHPEIRRAISSLGALEFFERPKYLRDGSATPELVIDTILKLSEKRIGALIAFERGISLKPIEATGVTTDAVFSHELILSIFTPPMPLHDGGLIVRNARIAAAHCIFPISNTPALISTGLRHRAAVGLSEETDAMVIIISEETGAVSIARNGKIFKYKKEECRNVLKKWIPRAMNFRQREGGMLSMANKLLQRFTPSETPAEKKDHAQ